MNQLSLASTPLRWWPVFRKIIEKHWLSTSTGLPKKQRCSQMVASWISQIFVTVPVSGKNVASRTACWKSCEGWPLPSHGWQFRFEEIIYIHRDLATFLATFWSPEVRDISKGDPNESFEKKCERTEKGALLVDVARGHCINWLQVVLLHWFAQVETYHISFPFWANQQFSKPFIQTS